MTHQERVQLAEELLASAARFAMVAGPGPGGDQQKAAARDVEHRLGELAGTGTSVTVETADQRHVPALARILVAISGCWSCDHLTEPTLGPRPANANLDERRLVCDECVIRGKAPDPVPAGHCSWCGGLLDAGDEPVVAAVEALIVRGRACTACRQALSGDEK